METIHFVILCALIFGSAFATSEVCNDDEEGCKHLIRKRRAVGEDVCTDGAKTSQQASDELKGYEGQFALNSFNDTTMAKKRQFLTAAKNLLPAVCKNLNVGAEAAEAVSTLAQLHVQRKACNETGSTLSDVPCEGCSKPKIGRYRVTSNALEKNSQWNCSQGNDTCDGVCIGSMRMPRDFLSNYSSVCRSHVIHVQMFDPKTSQPVAVDNAGEVMSVEIEFDGNRERLDNSDYKCFMWQHNTNSWDGSLCNLTILQRKSNKTPYVVQCNCTRLGSVCVAFNSTDINSSMDFSSTTAASTASGGSGGSSSTPATPESSGLTGSPGTTGSIVPGGSQSTGASTAGSGSSGTEGATSASVSGATQGASSGGSQTTAGSSGTDAVSQGGTSASVSGASQGASSGGSQTTVGSSSSSNVDNSGIIFVKLKFEGECSAIKGTKNEQPFRTEGKAALREHLKLGDDQIFNVEVECGSIILSFTISQLDPSALEYNISNVGSQLISNFTITLPDGSTWKSIEAHVGYAPGNTTTFTIPKPTLPPTTGKRYELVFDYTPIMMAIAIGIASLVMLVCCTCIVHSWYLRKNKFTEYNSMTIKEYERKMRAKEQKNGSNDMEDNAIPMTNMGGNNAAPKTTTNFDMTNEVMPKINETNLANYHWAQTSHLPTMLAQPYDMESEEPRLILDSDSDSDSDGQDNKGFEKSNVDLTKTVSHLSLDKEDPNIAESNDALSRNDDSVFYDNVTDSPEDGRNPTQEAIYDNVKNNTDDNPNGPPPVPPPRPK